MSLFSSSREARLWSMALAVVIAIYSTLGLARTISDLIFANPMGEALFMVCCVVILVVVVTQGLTRQPGLAEFAVAGGVVATYALVFSRMALVTERSHLVEYGIVAIIVYEALQERARNGRRVPVPALIAIGVTSLLGVVDECIQLYIPNRYFDPLDIVFNVGAAVLAVTASASLAWARRRGASR